MEREWMCPVEKGVLQQWILRAPEASTDRTGSHMPKIGQIELFGGEVDALSFLVFLLHSSFCGVIVLVGGPLIAECCCHEGVYSVCNCVSVGGLIQMASTCPT